MASDSSQLLYVCPFCRASKRDEESIRRHISAQVEGHPESGFKMDRPLEIREPHFGDYDFDVWDETIEVMALDVRDSDDVYVEKIEETVESHGKEIPKPYIIFALERLGFKPVDSLGRSMSGKANTAWDDLTDKRKDTLLAWAYWPELTHDELEGLPLVTVQGQSQVSKIIRDYGWMLSHPDVNTPISPSESSEQKEGEMTTELPGDLDGLFSDEQPPEPVEASSASEALQSDSDTDEGDASESETESTERTVSGPRTEARGEPDQRREREAIVGLHQSETFDVIVALVKDGQYELAREVFRRATGEPLDARWSG